MTYVFIKLFKKNSETEFTRAQQIGLTLGEWEGMFKNKDAIYSPNNTTAPNHNNATTPVSTCKRGADSTPPNAPAKRLCTTTPVGREVPVNPIMFHQDADSSADAFPYTEAQPREFEQMWALNSHANFTEDS